MHDAAHLGGILPGFVLKTGRNLYEHGTGRGQSTPPEPNNPNLGSVMPDVFLQATARRMRGTIRGPRGRQDAGNQKQSWRLQSDATTSAGRLSVWRRTCHSPPCDSDSWLDTSSISDFLLGKQSALWL